MKFRATLTVGAYLNRRLGFGDTIVRSGPMVSTRLRSNGADSADSYEFSAASSSTKGPAGRKQKPHTKAKAMWKRTAGAKTSSVKNKKDDSKRADPHHPATVADVAASSAPWYRAFTKGHADYEVYMQTEWGFERRGDLALFEQLSLEGAQSGLSWLTILRKRDAYRRTFHGFDVDKVAAMVKKDDDNDDETSPAWNTVVEEIVGQTGESQDIVVRHAGKIRSVIKNAKCIVRMRSQEVAKGRPKEDVFDRFMWSFVNDKPILNRRNRGDIVSLSPESTAMSKALKKLGFRFVGPTTCYALMQSLGMVIDHPVDTPEWKSSLKRLEKRPGGYQHGLD